MQLSSTNKTILLISDPHQEIDKLEYILKKESHDHVVCLGDYFDSFTHDTLTDLNKTCKFLKHYVDDDKYTNLMGNHDTHYLYDNIATPCSGYTAIKHQTIKKNLGKSLVKIRDSFRWYVWVDDFLCTHAGIASSHLPPHQNLSKNNLSVWLDDQTTACNTALLSNKTHWFFRAGRARGGRQPVGGLTWLDFNTEFESIDGLKQIVGHTSHNSIAAHVTDGTLNIAESDNLDIDCHLNQYLLITNQKINIKNYNDL